VENTLVHARGVEAKIDSESGRAREGLVGSGVDGANATEIWANSAKVSMTDMRNTLSIEVESVRRLVDLMTSTTT
jgi:hypothetical protein